MRPWWAQVHAMRGALVLSASSLDHTSAQDNLLLAGTLRWSLAPDPDEAHVLPTQTVHLVQEG